MRSSRILLSLTLLAILATAVWAFFPRSAPAPGKAPGPIAAERETAELQTSAVSPAPDDESDERPAIARDDPPPPNPATEFDPIEAALAELNMAHEALLALASTWQQADERARQEAAAIIDQLMASLEATEESDVVAALLAFLTNGRDAELPFSLTIGPGGHLHGAPRFRVIVLDWLGRWDAEAAASYADQVFATRNSADEWALSLRNLIWAANENDHATRSHRLDQARARVTEMMNHQPWRDDPSDGYLESMDLIVYIRSHDLTPFLAENLRTAEPALRHASFVTLDRLMLADPLQSMQSMKADGHQVWERMGERHRAGFVARLSPVIPEHRQELADYVLNPAHSPEELAYFFSLFPNYNLMISYNLVTPERPSFPVPALTGFRQAQALIETWRADPRYSHRRELLDQAAKRFSEILPNES